MADQDRAAQNALKTDLRNKANETLQASGWGPREAEEGADIVLDVVFGQSLVAAAPLLLEACERAVADAETAVNPAARLPQYEMMKAAIEAATKTD